MLGIAELKIRPKFRAAMIYNPLAGMLDVQPAVDGIVRFWQARGWQVDPQPTRRAGHARELAAEAVAQDYDMVLAAGGDGTLGEIASALAKSKCIMAPLPSGTGNSFAKELSLPLRSIFGEKDLVRACKALANGTIRYIDLGFCDHSNYWLQWTGIGVDGHIIHRIEPRSRRVRRLGRIGYYILGLYALRDYHGMSATIVIDDQVFEGENVLIMISNCRRYAGGEYVLNPDAVLDDGIFEVRMFAGSRKRDVLSFLMELLRGRILTNSNIRVARGTRMSVTTKSPAPVHRDGDPAGFTPVNCHVEPASLKILVPYTASPSLFLHSGSPFIG